MPTIGSFDNRPRGRLRSRIQTSAESQGVSSIGFTEDNRRDLTREMFNREYSENRGLSWTETLSNHLDASAIDLADSVYGNKLIPGTERGDVWNLVEDNGGDYGRELTEFYERNQAAVEATSGIAGAVGTAYLGGAFILPRAASALANSTAISSSRLWQAGAGFNAAVRTRVQTAQMEAAQKGIAFSEYSKPALAFRGLEAGKMAGVVGAEEVLIGVTMNANKMAWSEEMSENLVFGGLGLVAGGALGSLAARHQIRKRANSPELIKARKDAFDPQGIHELQEWHTLDDAKAAIRHEGTKGKESASATAHMLAARQSIPEGEAPELRNRHDTQRVVSDRSAMQSLQKISSKGIPGVGGSRFDLGRRTTTSEFGVEGGPGKHLHEAMTDDPLTAFGMDSMGLPVRERGRVRLTQDEMQPEPHTNPVVQQAREDFHRYGGDSKRLNVAAGKLGEGDQRVYQTEVEEIGRRMTEAEKVENKARLEKTPLGRTLEMRRAYLERLRATGNIKNIRRARLLEEQQAQILIGKRWAEADSSESKNFSSYRPGRIKLSRPSRHEAKYTWKSETGNLRSVDDNFRVNRNVAKLPENERMEVGEAVNHVMATMLRGKKTFTLPKSSTWFQIDSALEYERRGGTVDWESQAGLRNSEDAMVESLIKKYEEIGDQPIGDYWTRQAYNLPLPDAKERMYDSHGDAMRAVLQAANDGGDLAELTTLHKHMTEINGFDLKRSDQPLHGDFFNFNRDSDGNWREPVIGFFDNVDTTNPFSRETIAEGTAQHYLDKVSFLRSGDSQGGIAPGLTDSTLNMPEFRMSRENVQALADDQVTGLGNRVRQTIGEVPTNEFRRRDNPTTLGLMRVVENKNQWVNNHVSTLVRESFGDLIGQLSAAPNAASKALVNQFHSFRSGWDIDPKMVDLGDGYSGFRLLNTDRNKARLGRDVEEGELMKAPRSGRPIALDSVARQYVTGVDRLNKRVLADINRIRAAKDLPPFRYEPYHVPPVNTKGKHLGFVFDGNNRLVSGGAVVAKSRYEFDRLAAQKQKELQPGQIFRTSEQIRETADLWDRAGMDWIDPGTLVGPTKASAGTLTSDTVNPNSVQDYLNWVQNQVDQIGTGVLRTLYEPQLGIVRARGAIEHDVRGLTDSTQRTIWDEYESILLGRRFGQGKRSNTGALMRTAENFLDKNLEALWPSVSWMAPSQVSAWTQDIAQKMGFTKLPGRVRSFEEITDKLKEHSPYRTGQEYLESVHRIAQPPEVKAAADGMNQLATAHLLRYLELPQASMNMLGVMQTMPSIVRNGRAPVTTFMEGKQGRVPITDYSKIMREGMKDMYRPSRHPDWEFMQANGDTTQSAAEYFKQMSVVQDRGTFGRIFFGDKSVEIPQGGPRARRWGKQMQRLGIDGLLGIATDTTENWSRIWAHFTGLRLADYHGIQDMTARHNFARETANAVIANYSPMNKPELYHSALGSMFGHFMSWMQSYNQRLFRWVEEGDYRAVGRQAAWQSSMFGLTSLPGYNYVESTLLSMGIGETEQGAEATMMDHIYARFGPGVGSMLATGGIEQFGLSLYTRGDMNYRDVTLDPTRLAAGFSVMNDTYNIVKETAQTMFNDYSLEDSNRFAEILSRHLPNRAMKGVLTVLANDGKDVDARGQVVAETRDFFESAVRSLGVRSSRQQAQIEAFYANKNQEDREANRMDVLRKETRAVMRQSDWPSRLGEMFTKYVKAGGQPGHFRTWLKDQVRAANSPRALNEVESALRSGNNQQEVWRYEMYGGF